MEDFAAAARASVAAARIGTLTTYARHPSGQHSSAVTVHPQRNGAVEFHLARNAHGVRQLLARPAATLELAPAGCQPVLLHGAAHRLPGLGSNGTLRF